MRSERFPLASSSAFVLSVLGVVAVSTLNIVMDIQYDRGCGGYLKRAATANTPQLAQGNLKRAINWLEENGCTSGYTSILYRTPDEDVGYWYENLKQSEAGLSALTASATELEKSNALMKLHETLLHRGEGGDHIVQPEGIETYPYNKITCVLILLFLAMACAFIVPVGVYVARNF